MILSATQMDELLDIAIAAARCAGSVLFELAGKTLEVQRKPGGSLASKVVTQADVQSQMVIIQHLMPSMKKYDLALLSEEQTDDGSRFFKDYFWCIDPLDGTLPFIEGNPGYSVVISLISRQGVALLGVILDGATRTLYCAKRDEGCVRNGIAWHNLKTKDSDLSVANVTTLTVVLDRSTLASDSFASIEATLQVIAEELGYQDVRFLNYGGAAMNAMYMLESGNACYFKLPRTEESGGSIWDYGASACIVREWGGTVGDVNGAPLELNRSGSTFLNHRGFIYATEIRLAAAIEQHLASIENRIHV